MALNGWHWTIFGGIISAVSGYVYLTTSKSGTPNYSMALFFFIGIIFLIIGVLKLFFRRVDDKSVFDSAMKSENSNKVTNLGNSNNSSNSSNAPQKGISVQVDLTRPAEQNKIDEAIANLAKEQETKNKPVQHHAQHQTHHAVHQGTHNLDTGYSNTYSKTHQYHGPTKTIVSSSANATHPINAHVQPKVLNSEHGVKCRKCGAPNTGSANYCHGCGNRLK